MLHYMYIACLCDKECCVNLLHNVKSGSYIKPIWVKIKLGQMIFVVLPQYQFASRFFRHSWR
jgi:hypothetical protein